MDPAEGRDRWGDIQMFRVLAAFAVLAVATTAASAQSPEFQPIDTNSLIVRPVDQAAGFFSGATRTLSRVVANTIQSDGIVRTINSLFGREATSARVMPNGINPAAYPTYSSPLFHAKPTFSDRRR